MHETLDKMECDGCRKVDTAQETYIEGGQPFNSWFSVWKRGTKTFDFCSSECLHNFDFDHYKKSNSK